MFDDYESYEFAADMRNGHEARHDVYVRGEGPSLMLMHELPGLEVKTKELAERLISDGFRVHLPHILGPIGKRQDIRNSFRAFCLRREFSLFAKHHSSPIVDWLGALTVDIQERDQTDQVGIIGMCLTGNFALTLLARDGVAAAVASQPALPFAMPWMDKGAIHMSADEISETREAMATKGGALAIRYRGDRLSPAGKMDTIRDFFAPHVETQEYEGDSHSLLTYDLREEAYAKVHAHLRDRMGI